MRDVGIIHHYIIENIYLQLVGINRITRKNAGCGHYTSLHYKEHLFTITLCGKLPKVLVGINRITCKNKPLMRNSAKKFSYVFEHINQSINPMTLGSKTKSIYI